MVLSDYLRETRLALNEKNADFSLRKVAMRVGVVPSYLSKIERGLEKPSESLLCLLAEEYQLNEDVLLAMSGKVSSKLQAIILKNPVVFSNLIVALESVPDDALLRIVQEVKDGDW